MSSDIYSLKVSPQGQVTLPRELRERLHVQPGSRISITVTDETHIQISGKLPITKHFGRLSKVWTENEQDAAEYTRKLRDTLQPKLDQPS